MKLIFLIAACFLGVIPFHELSVQSWQNNTIHFSEFAGKKVLIVNTATNSKDSAQFREMEELYQLYNNKLIVLAVPSNDFGHEPLADADIKAALVEKYNIHFLLAGKQSVKDSATISPLFQWLTRQSENGVADNKAATDFYKFLINENGRLVGIFSNEIHPTDSRIKEAIK